MSRFARGAERSGSPELSSAVHLLRGTSRANAFGFTMQTLVDLRKARRTRPRRATHCDQERALIEAADTVRAAYAEAVFRMLELIDITDSLDFADALQRAAEFSTKYRQAKAELANHRMGHHCG